MTGVQTCALPILDLELEEVKSRINDSYNELRELSDYSDIAFLNFAEHDHYSYQDCKNRVELIKSKEKNIMKDMIDSSSSKSVPSLISIKDQAKQILRLFESETEEIIASTSAKNIDSQRIKLIRSFETLNQLFKSDGVAVPKNLLELKLEKIILIHESRLKLEQQKEEQKAIREQMLEEEKARRELEAAMIDRKSVV